MNESLLFIFRNRRIWNCSNKSRTHNRWSMWNWQIRRSIYAKHFSKITIHPDTRTIKSETLPDFDILVAGFPCQSFSIAGKRRGFEDSRGTLFFKIARIAQEKRPRHLLLENIKGLLSHEGGNTVRKIFKILDELGYDTQSSIVNTKDFLPQNRSVSSLSQLLESTVSEKYFLSEKAMKGIIQHDKNHKKKGNGFKIKLVEQLMPTITKDRALEPW